MVDPALPGADLIEAGLKDLQEQRESVASLLVAIGAPRLRHLGLPIPSRLTKIRNIAFMISSPKMNPIPRTLATMP